MGKQALRLLLFTPLALSGLVVFMVVDANLQQWLGRNWMLGALAVCICVNFLLPWRTGSARRKIVPKAGACACCGYDICGDRRKPDYCPQCGRLQKRDVHLRRQRQLMLELERLQMEFVRNHRARIAASKRHFL